MGGEPRARYLYVRDGALDDVLSTWRDCLGGDAVVCTRDEAIDAGWFGAVDDRYRERIGDVVVAMLADISVVDTRLHPREARLVGQHGSVTAGRATRAADRLRRLRDAPHSLLVDPPRLAANSPSSRPPVVIDVRWSLAGPPGILAYRAGTSRARGSPISTPNCRDSVVLPAGTRCPSRPTFAALMRRLGVADDSCGRGLRRSRFSAGVAGLVGSALFRPSATCACSTAGTPAGSPPACRSRPSEPVVVPGVFTAGPGGLPMLVADSAAAVGDDWCADRRPRGGAVSW